MNCKKQENNSQMYLRLHKHREVRCDRDDKNQLMVFRFSVKCNVRDSYEHLQGEVRQ